MKVNKKIEAKIKTKSNFKGLNGTWLQIQEIVGTRVTCYYFSDEFQRLITLDFTLKEIQGFRMN